MKPLSKLFFNKVLLLIFCCYWSISHAHQMSTAYLTLSHSPLQESLFASDVKQPIGEQQLYGQLQLKWLDLQQLISLDSNQDGELSWAEVDTKAPEIKTFVQQHLAIKRDEQPCPLNFDDDIQTAMHFDEAYLVLTFSSTCLLNNANAQALSIDYSALFSQDPQHTLLVNADLFKQHFSGVIDTQNHVLLIELESSNVLKIVGTYIYQGILHIFKGTDHILFLCALLLTCVLERKDHHWVAKTQLRNIIKDTAWVITAFTLAHSITLTATAMDVIVPSSRWVEFGIALSVMLTALNNIWPLVLRLGWITFAFGLLHGMGFAGVLGELGIAKEQKLVSVLSFNLGVECGQLMILAVLLPLLLLVGKRRWYQRYGLQMASAIIALIALQWCIERF